MPILPGTGAGATTAPQTSNIWSGLVNDGLLPQYTQVGARWNVPSVTPTDHTSYEATWVGVNGYYSQSVLQTGTMSYTNPDGTTGYYAWTELYPTQPGVVIVGLVHPGDTMYANIQQISSTTWVVIINDVTTGQSATTSYAYGDALTSAEWINEDPSGGSTSLPLADFGTDNFTAMTVNGAPEDASTLTPVNMVQNNVTVAYPTNFSTPGGTSFEGVYSGPTLAPPPPTTSTTPITTTVPSTTTTVPSTTTTVPTTTTTVSPPPTPPPTPSGCDGVIPPGSGVAMASTADGNGYWITSTAGQVVACGDAVNYGGTAGHPLNLPIVGMAADPQTGGYWLVASDGGIFAFNAPFYGSTGGIHLNKPIVGMAATASGYRLLASDGGVFDFNTLFFGSAVAP